MVGHELTSPTGETYRPSTFLTLTLPSYGPVHADGTPKNPDSYDYRRAALDALHFAKLLDRFWQNLRRCAGYKVQYFGCVEPQRRLALHAHAAVRGAIPRGLIRAVAAATYEQIWWPAHDEAVYVRGHLPVWDERISAYVDPDTWVPLVSWEQAMDATYQSADQTGDDGTPRYVWEPVDITPGTDLETYRVIMRRQITERLRWQHQYAEAKQALTAARPPDDTHSATGRQREGVNAR